MTVHARIIVGPQADRAAALEALAPAVLALAQQLALSFRTPARTAAVTPTAYGFSLSFGDVRSGPVEAVTASRAIAGRLETVPGFSEFYGLGGLSVYPAPGGGEVVAIYS